MARDGSPPDLLVIAASKPWSCANCGSAFERGEFLTMDDAGPLCMDCADLGHLEFLPRGDSALTRRARRGSRLAAVVLQWSRARKRYERQGILAEADAIARAEQECLADSEVRERRRQRDAQRRADEDEQFVADLATAIRVQFPGCPAERAVRIARHAGARSSGRIGRTSAGRALDPEAVRLAVMAAIRHQDTRYEDLLMSGNARSDARELVRDDVDRVTQSWLAGR
ncbi:MAG: DUF2293 domain-containing protein [Jatrophihabitantaceae bacterium]